jgi:hypothetical protein
MDQIGPKIVVLDIDYMARLPPDIITKKNIFSNKQPTYVSWDYTYFELALLYKGNRPFLATHSPFRKFLDF